MCHSNLYRFFITLVLVFGLQLQSKAANNQQSDKVISPEVEQIDTQRLYKGLLDLGIYQTYRLSPSDLNSLTSEQAKEIIRIYINNYYAQYMYFSRNFVMNPTTDVYTADVIEKIQADFENKYGTSAKKLLTQFHREQGGVTVINSLLYQIVTEAVVNYEMKKFGKTLPQQFPAYNSPNSLYLAYLKKMKIRPNEYNPPFNPEMDTQQPVQKFSESLQGSSSISLTDEIKQSSNYQNWFFGLGGLLIGFVLSTVLGFLRKNAKT